MAANETISQFQVCSSTIGWLGFTVTTNLGQRPTVGSSSSCNASGSTGNPSYPSTFTSQPSNSPQPLLSLEYLEGCSIFADSLNNICTAWRSSPPPPPLPCPPSPPLTPPSPPPSPPPSVACDCSCPSGYIDWVQCPGSSNTVCTECCQEYGSGCQAV